MPLPARFTKVAGGGNDFLLFESDGRAATKEDLRRLALVCRRGLSVGADGALFLSRGEEGRLRPSINCHATLNRAQPGRSFDGRKVTRLTSLDAARCRACAARPAAPMLKVAMHRLIGAASPPQRRGNGLLQVFSNSFMASVTARTLATGTSRAVIDRPYRSCAYFAASSRCALLFPSQPSLRHPSFAIRVKETRRRFAPVVSCIACGALPAMARTPKARAAAAT